MAGGIAAAIGLVSLVAFTVRPMLAIDGPRFTSLYQGIVRMNTYVGLALASRLGGELGLDHAAIAIAVIVPLVNLTCVTSLAWLGEPDGDTRHPIVRSVFTNPLILGCLVGLLLNVSSIGSPPIVGDTAAILGRAALPLGLLAVGAALRWQSVASCRAAEVIGCVVKLVALPALTGLLLSWIGVTGIALTIGVLFTALPTAPSAYLLAREMGGDAEAMAALLSVQTVLSLFSLPIVLWWLV
ncbi:MAG: AEC family transporter, partial [Planctomycetota bacterium]